MSAAGSTDLAALPPVVRDAAEGRLPAWSQVKPRRREHMGRVAALLREWAVALGLPPAEVARWTAAGWLHDALRDADPEELRSLVPPAYRGLPDKVLHGPAAAERLHGQADEEILEAVRFHTLGCRRFGALGRALYLADFLEPGRTFSPEWTESLRRRMPGEMEAVLREVVGARVAHVSGGGTVHPETEAFHASLEG